MTAHRPIVRVARDLQAAANRLELEVRNQDRDTVLAGVYAGHAKGAAAQARLDAQAAPIAALKADVERLRQELRDVLELVGPPPGAVLPPFEIEPPAKRSKK